MTKENKKGRRPSPFREPITFLLWWFVIRPLDRSVEEKERGKG